MIGALWLLPLVAAGGRAHADALRWSLRVAPGHVGVVEVLRPTDDGGEDRLLRVLCADGDRRSRMGWRPDEDPAPDRVGGSIELGLPAGFYVVQETDADGQRRRGLGVAAAAATVSGPLPAGATGVLAWRQAADGNDGFAWAPDAQGQAGLPLADGRWRLTPAGVGGWSPEDVEVRGGSPTAMPRFRARPAPTPRVRAGHPWAVRLGLLPVTLLLGAALFVGLRGDRGTKVPRGGHLLALVVALLVTAAALHPVLADPVGRALDAGPPIDDPAASTGLLATVSAGLARLTDLGTAYAFPEGCSWLVPGPAWLGFLPASLVAAVAGPVAGHNLGMALGLFLLALTSQALARDLGARPAAAALAGVATALGPAILDELDAASLDRSTLWLVPLALLALNRAAERPGWRWPLLAGAAIAAVFYGQVYYGLYLAAACPWLALPRLLGPAPRARLLRLLAAGAVALALLLPGLAILRAGTAASPYAPTAQAQAAQPAWSDADVAAFLVAHDPSLGGTTLDRSLPMDTPAERRLSAAALGLSLPEVLRPADLLAGRALFWPLVLLSVALAHRRRAAALVVADVAILLLHAMGPALRATPTTLGPPLPFALDMALIPGFDQLKNSYRFGMMAAAIAPVPLALGFDGLLHRLPARVGAHRALPLLSLPVAAAAGLALAALRLPAIEPDLGPVADDRPWAVDLRWPQAIALPPAAALDEIAPGPAFLLPLSHPTPPRAIRTATARGFSLANPPPFDSGDPTDLPQWVEDDPLLNRAAWTAGSDRAGVWLELDAATAERSRADLAAAGLRYLILDRARLADPLLATETEALLDRHLSRVADDGVFAAWSLAPTSTEHR